VYEDSGCEKAASHHTVAAADLRELAGYHAAQAEVLKAAIAADLQKVQPTGVSVVPRFDAPTGAFGMAAPIGPRAGQPDVDFDKAAVPPQFRHLFEINED